MAKVKDDDIVFQQKATQLTKKQKQALKAKGENKRVGEAEGARIDADADGEAVFSSRLNEKRQRNNFKKLYHLNTYRILKILGYIPTQSDERKFLFSNYK